MDNLSSALLKLQIFLSSPMSSLHRLNSKFLGIFGQVHHLMREHVILPPLEPILHPSPRRIRWLGIFALCGNPLFFGIWGYWLIQPYESITLRILVSLLGLILIIPYINRDPFCKSTSIIFILITWLQLPVLFSWMYLCNSGNSVWLASFSVMILLWYSLTDWRVATLGLAVGSLGARLLFEFVGPATLPLDSHALAINAIVIAFSFGAALTMGASSANVRQAALSFSTEKAKALQALSGSIAHEMRNPLSQIKYSLDCIGNSLPAPTATDLAHPIASQQLHELYRNLAQGHIAIKRGFQVISMTLSEVSSKPSTAATLTTSPPP
jgi:two-component system CAI-1 autoinducer sensor kinase/phosphatase CqsS